MAKKKSVAPKPRILSVTPSEQKAREDFVESGKPVRKRRRTSSAAATSKSSERKKSGVQKVKKARSGRPPLEEERVQMTIYLPRDLRNKLRKRALEESIEKDRKVPETDVVIEALIAHL